MPIHVSYLTEEVDEVAPGVRIVVPMDGTPQAQRGSFCALVDLQGAPDADVLVERMLSAMQRTYYSARGTQSQVISQTVNIAQSMISAETRHLTAPWKVGVVCVGVMADRLALAGLGNAFAFLTAEDGSVGVFPPDRLAAHAEDTAPTTDLWPLHRQKVGAVTAMIAGSGDWLNLVSVRTLAATAAYVDAGNCIDAADGLREQAGRDDVPGVIMVIDPDIAPPATPPPALPVAPERNEPPPKPSSAAPTSGGGLPTALNASPPVVSAPDASTESAASTPPASPLPAPRQASVDANASKPADADEDASMAVTAFERTPRANPATTDRSSWAASSARLAAGAKVGMDRTREFLESMLPERSETVSTPVMAEAAAVSAPSFAPAPSPPPKVRPASEPFTPPAPATGSRARILIAGAVILLLLVPAIVATLYWRQGAVGVA
ncbi:MAG: hypothetical protein R6W76_14580, partial [Caldilinea sp.]